MEASSLDKLRERFPKSFTKSGWLRQIGIDLSFPRNFVFHE